MKAFMKKGKKISSKETNKHLKTVTNGNDKNETVKNGEGVTNPLVQSIDSDNKLDGSGTDSAKIDLPPDVDMINKKLPKELILRAFSFLDTVSLCRSAQVSKVNP